MVTLRLSENFAYDVLALFSVNDVVALNNKQLSLNSPPQNVMLVKSVKTRPPTS